MDGIERAAEDAERPGRDRPGRRHARSQGCASHSSSVRADPDQVAGAIPARRSSASMPEPGEVALEALGRLLDVEVGLGRDPLDPRAADPEAPSPSSSTLKPSPIASIRWTTTPGRLGRLGQLGRRRAAARRAGPERRRRPRRSPPRWRRRPGRRPRARAGTPATPRAAAGRSILLNATSIGFSRSAGSCASQLLADDVVVPLRVARRAVDDVDQDPRPLDVAQERVARGRRRLLAPSISPGTSAIVGRRSSSSPRSMTPRFGSRVVNG